MAGIEEEHATAFNAPSHFANRIFMFQAPEIVRLSFLDQAAEFSNLVAAVSMTRANAEALRDFLIEKLGPKTKSTLAS